MSLSPTEKREHERSHLLEAMSLRRDLFPAGDFRQQESPDFLFDTEAGLVGVEVVDYQQGPISEHGSEMRIREEQQWAAVERARDTYRSLRPEGPVLEVTVAYRSGSLPDAELPRILGEFVSANIPEMNSHSLHSDLERPLGDVVLSVLVVNFESLRQDLWTVSGVSSYGWRDSEIQELIDTKRAKAHSYLDACEEVRLLIVSGAQMRLASTLGLPEGDLEPFEASPFSRVLVFERWGQSVLDLPLLR